MKQIDTPQVFLVGKPQIDPVGMASYLELVGGEDWFEQRFFTGAEPTPGASLIEFMGRLCYRSWKPGLNANVTRIREDQSEYLLNVLNSGHGSVLEHAVYNFAVAFGSRVFTHELVRHKTGTAVSQESMRFVRLDDIAMWLPEWARQDEPLLQRTYTLLSQLEDHQVWLAEHFGLDDEGVPFAVKKAKTSFMRRMAPDGVATHVGWSANIRALRWIIENRTTIHAEEEIRIVFDQIARIMCVEEPMLFQDFTVDDEGQWVPANRKV